MNEKKTQITNNQDLQKYIQELMEDTEVKLSNVREKSLLCNSNQSKWLSYLFHEKETLNRILETKQKILKKEINNNVSDSVLRLKNEKNILENNENIKKLNLLQKNVKDNIDFIERALSILSNMSFQIKNIIDIIKLTSN